MTLVQRPGRPGPANPMVQPRKIHQAHVPALRNISINNAPATIIPRQPEEFVARDVEGLGLEQFLARPEVAAMVEAELLIDQDFSTVAEFLESAPEATPLPLMAIGEHVEESAGNHSVVAKYVSPAMVSDDLEEIIQMPTDISEQTFVPHEHLAPVKQEPAMTTETNDALEMPVDLNELDHALLEQPVPVVTAVSVDAVKVTDDQEMAVAAEPEPVSNPKVTLDLLPIGGPANPAQTPLALLNTNLVHYNAKLSQFGNLRQFQDPTTKQYSGPFMSWFSSLYYGSDHSGLPIQSEFDDNAPRHASQSTCTQRPGSSWYQNVKHDGGTIGPSKASFKPTTDARLVGDASMERVQNAIGLGATINIPLWHSGIWLTLKAPSETDLLLLAQKVATEKSNLGYQTGGALFSNSTVYLIHHLYEFILRHTISANVVGWNPEQKAAILGKLVNILDIQWMALGQSLTIYPKGYAYEYGCLEGPVKCQHVTRAQLNLARLFWVDRTQLTEAQIRHMSSRLESHTPEAIKAYQNMGNLSTTRVVSLNENVSAVLRMPTILESVNSGFKWVDEVTGLVNGTFGMQLPDQQRDAVIVSMSNITEMRQYGHMVSKIFYPNNTLEGTGEAEFVDDPDTIARTLSELSADPVCTKAFFDGVSQFIDDSTVAMVALPNYECEACHLPRADKSNKHPALVPIDAMSLFFTLKDLKLMKGYPRPLMQPT